MILRKAEIPLIRNCLIKYSPFAKCPADEVQSYRVNAAVDEAEAKTDNPEGVPIIVVVFLGRRAKVEPQHERVIRQKANDEDDHESDYHLSDLLVSKRFNLLRCFKWLFRSRR